MLTYIFIAQLSCFLLFGVWLYKNGGLSKHFSIAFVAFVYFFITLFTPFFDWYRDIDSHFSYYYGQYELKAQVVYLTGTVAILGAYIISSSRLATWLLSQIKFKYSVATPFSHEIGRLYWLTTTILFALVLFNVHASGVNLLSLFDLSNKELGNIIFSIYFYSDFLENLTNSLITCGIALYYYYKKKPWYWALLLVLLAYFFLSGWRFRIFLTLFGIAVIYLQSTPEQFYKRLLIALLGLTLTLSYLTLNRMAVAKRMFDVVEWNALAFNLDLLCNETGNSRTAKAMMRYRAENNLPLDGGMSMIGYIFVKLMPASLYPNQEKPIAPLLRQVKAWIPEGAVDYNPNPAISNMDEIYFSFGLPGLIFFMSLMAIGLAIVEHARMQMHLKPYLYVLFLGFLYQWITRGYLPQQVQLLFFLLLPFWVEWLYLRWRMAKDK
jgi:hypothetical protein